LIIINYIFIEYNAKVVYLDANIKIYFFTSYPHYFSTVVNYLIFNVLYGFLLDTFLK